MGIRFSCPNGHKLHVKAFLAGKRGICPDCDARFFVPSASGDSAQPIEDSPRSDVARETVAVPALDPEGPAAETKLPVSAPPSGPANLASSAKAQTSELSATPMPTEGAGPGSPVWYVRPASGDQYGPATTETMCGWVTEGRVLRDSMIWRTGWPDWKTGEEALSLLGMPMVCEPPVAVPVEIEPPVATFKAAVKSHQARKRSRRDRARLITIALMGLVLLLLIAVVLVVQTGGDLPPGDSLDR